MFRIEDVGAGCTDATVLQQAPLAKRSDAAAAVAAAATDSSSDSDTCDRPKVSATYNVLDDVLGRGAFAVVRTCVNRVTNQEFAVKIIEKDRENETRKRIWREIQTFYWCSNHPNVISLIEYFEEKDKFYLIFEKMRGGSLLQHIQRRVCFTEWEASLVVRDVASALSFLHNLGVAHRDVKPENILCMHPDSVVPVKLCDLDLASTGHLTSKHKAEMTRDNMQSPVGSAEFMAPEVVDAFMGEKLSYDKRCDLWSLGVIVYMMLCGYPPFYGECSRASCGWQKGLPCDDCQSTLFSRIQSGKYHFYDEDWKVISEEAKDLIRHLLVRDVEQRYLVSNVLSHPWVANGAPMTLLRTPDVLMRNESARDLNQLAEDFVVANRIAFTENDDGGGGGANVNTKYHYNSYNTCHPKNHLAMVQYPQNVTCTSKSAERKQPSVRASSGSDRFKPIEKSGCIGFGHHQQSKRRVADDAVSVNV